MCALRTVSGNDSFYGYSEGTLSQTASSSFVLGWVPIMDGRPVFAWMSYTTNGFHGFERSPILATRVLVLSRMGSHSVTD